MRLTWEDRQNVKFCIPYYLRNEQIRLNMRLVKQRLEPRLEDHTSEPVAVVAFGPSLRDTWEGISGFQRVISCSGAHKFLIERGIVPTWHVEVDPRAYKIDLLGEPHRDVHYLPCSAVHPDYIRHLLKASAKVTLWHVFGTEDASQRITPRGEWMITGGCDAGLRAVTIARVLGHVNLHLFGFDGSAPQPGPRHADKHPNPVQALSVIDYDGRTFYTTPAMLEAAKGLFHELEQLPDVTPTFYGDGLIQHRAKTWVRINYAPVAIAAIQAPLISDKMLARHRTLHEENPAYGDGGARWARMVRDLVRNIGKNREGPISVLDYGCGKGFLSEELDFPIWEYDPAVAGKDRLPRPADLVVCADVLEHIEPEQLDSVLDDLRRVTLHVGVFVICTSPSFKTFHDGTSTHLIIMPKTWWQMKLAEYFEIGKTIEANSELVFVLGPKKKPKKMVARTISVGGQPKGNLDKKKHRLVLAKIINERGWKCGAEIGCLRGDTTFHLLESCQDVSLYAVDVWAPFDGMFYAAELGEQKRTGPVNDEGTVELITPFDLIEERFREKAAQYNGRLTILKGLSWEVAAAVEDETLDFVFIDADHIEPSVRKDIEAWRPKVRSGGMLMGHDVHLPSVRRAVDDLCPGWQHLEQEIWALPV